MHYNITGVRVNTICPSTVDSTMVEHVQPHRVYFAEETQAALAESKPTWLPYVAFIFSRYLLEIYNVNSFSTYLVK